MDRTGYSLGFVTAKRDGHPALCSVMLLATALLLVLVALNGASACARLGAEAQGHLDAANQYVILYENNPSDVLFAEARAEIDQGDQVVAEMRAQGCP